MALVAGLAIQFLVPASRAQELSVTLNPAQTNIEFALHGNFHTVHGTFKLKSGAMRFNPSTGTASGAVIVDATSGESGNTGRDRKMHREILESARFPEIVFTPEQVTGTFDAQAPSHLEVSGQFRLHGSEHALVLPVDVQPSGSRLQVAARITIPYVEWGLKNPSTFILRVSDKVEIDIHTAGEVK